MLVAFFAYYHPTCSEILELHRRYHWQHIDHWIMVESTLTHAGRPAESGLRDRLQELDWDPQRVTIIDLDIPLDAQLDLQTIDHYNTYENFTNRKLGQGDLANVRARARERLQKDSVIKVLDRFPDDTVFVHSDCDEIIDPRHLSYLAATCLQNQDVVIKIPLVYLQGRADLRTHVRSTGEPVAWDGGMFLATKRHFTRATPTQIRSTNFNCWPIRYITEDGRRVEDLGWHFSWMGTAQQRLDKSQNFTHYLDDLSWLDAGSYSSDRHRQWINQAQPTSGTTPPSGDSRHVLLPYDTGLLPSVIRDHEPLCRFLLP